MTEIILTIEFGDSILLNISPEGRLELIAVKSYNKESISWLTKSQVNELIKNLKETEPFITQE